MLRNATVPAVVLGLMLVAPPLQAQEAGDGPRGQLSISPILALAEWFTGELEYGLSDKVSGVFGFSYYSPEDTYTAFDGKLRFYPGGTLLEGFNISGLIGFTSIGDDASNAEVSGMTAGVDLGWSWLFGDEKRWFLGLGLGAKRYFGDENLGGETIDLFLPMARLNFGITF